MSIALYFGKINMSSSQLGDVITNNASFRTILSNVLNALKDDITYTHHYTKQVDDKTIVEDIEYSLSVKEKNDNELIGYIHKKSYLNYKDFDKNNKEKSSFAKNEEIYVLVNKSLPAGSLKLTATGTANKYVGVIYGKGSWQNFVFLDTEQVDVSGSATASWKESKGNIAVVKSDQDKKPVQGAEFSLLDSNGKQVATGKTDANGNLNFNKLDLGNYTLIESSVPDGYIIEKASYNITVKRNQTTKVEVKNTKVKGVLQITKIEKNAKTPIAGDVFEIYDANNKVVAKITSNELFTLLFFYANILCFFILWYFHIQYER